jgi:hypothetical protein
VSTDSTGPKISSWAIRWLWLTPVKTVGRNQNRSSAAGSRCPSAGRALGLAGGAQLGDPVELAAAVDGADVGVLVHRVTDPQGRQAALEPAVDVVGDRLLDEREPGAADVALVEEDAVDDALDGLVERGVVEDDVGRLAAELEGGALAGAGDARGRSSCRPRRAGEGDLVDARVVDDRRRCRRRR